MKLVNIPIGRQAARHNLRIHEQRGSAPSRSPKGWTASITGPLPIHGPRNSRSNFGAKIFFFELGLHEAPNCFG